MNERDIYAQVLKAGKAVFLEPEILYPYDDVIGGVSYEKGNKTKTGKAIATNTTQAFGHKLNDGNFYDNKKAAMELFDEYFLANREEILHVLNSEIKAKSEMDSFEQSIVDDMKKQFRGHYKTAEQVDESYNRFRKVIDIYIEHIVAMANEIAPDRRVALAPWLFLPIDSQIIKQKTPAILEPLDRWGLNERSTFGSITTAATYAEIQDYLEEKAQGLSKAFGETFHVIFFDMFWRERYKAPGQNLFGAEE